MTKIEITEPTVDREPPESERVAAPAFVTGDVVRLKSGGFPMTISRDPPTRTRVDTETHGEVVCAWHDANGQCCWTVYQEAMLLKATATDLATGAEVPTETMFDGRPPTWRDRRGL